MDLVVNHSSDEVSPTIVSKAENEYYASTNGSSNHDQVRTMQSVIGTFGDPRGTTRMVHAMNQTIGDRYSKVRAT